MRKDEDLKQRTKMFALRVIRLYGKLPKTTDAQVLGKQILRSETSVAANYREAVAAGVWQKPLRNLASWNKNWTRQCSGLSY